MSFVLTGAAAADPTRAGGKGASLARLSSFEVPAFFVITPDAFDDAGLRADAQGELSAALERLGHGPFAVRSSGLEEDGASAAHAGQFATELNVTRADVPAAAHRVWRSGFTQSLAEYRKAHGLSGAGQPPAVVVQVMVKAISAGVCFAADPVTGERDVAIVSAVHGLADRLVGGEVDGDTYRVSADGRTLAAELVGADPVLTDAQRAEVAALARAASRHFGAPQDIEWAFDASGLKLLQSRPITTLPAPSDDDITIWDNSNIVESYPGIVSPLTFSFARYVYAHVYRAFASLMGVSRTKVAANDTVFENMLGRVDARVYYNLLNWYRALALFPGFKANRAFMEGMMGVSEALPPALADRIAPPEPNAFKRFLDQLGFMRVGFGLIWKQVRLRPMIDRFYDRLNASLATPDATIDAMSAVDLARAYRQLERELLSRWDAPLVNDFLCMIAFGAAQKAMASWAGEEGRAYLSDLLIGQGDIISAEPARRIKEMGRMIADSPAIIDGLARGDRSAAPAGSDIGRALDAYVARFGDRCTEELKLESPTLHEDDRALLAAVAAAARAPTTAATAKAPTPVLSDLIDAPLKRRLAEWLLGWAKARVRDRENLRFERTRLFGRVRRIFLGIGQRLAEAGLLTDRRDIFLLTVEEVLGAVEGSSVATDLKALVNLRRTELEQARNRPDPPERFTVRGAHAIGIADIVAHAPAAMDASEARKGLACCKGAVTAKVRVVDDPRTQALSPGEILVARHTDPGWIAVFANAAGVIAERGSLLSHSAIVAREMGVPCVVALKGVTQWLRTGDVVELDGGAGTVKRVAKVDA